MDETLRKLDELALELKLLTTEMREKGPSFEAKVELRDLVDEIDSWSATL